MSQESDGGATVYGHFDEARREYVVTEPLTPRAWINFLSNGRMGAIASAGAGGLAWYIRPESRRISRYDFMGLPEDRPGFYVYIREADGTTWNPSYQPCQTPVDSWEGRHGMGYTRFVSARNGLEAELVLFVPPTDDVLLWDLRLRNNRDTDERLFLANYIEFSLFEYYRELLAWIVLRNQISFTYDEKLHTIKYDPFVCEAPHNTPVFLTGTGTPAGFDCDRPAFIGRGRDTSNPLAVEEARSFGSELHTGGLGIGSLSYEIDVPAGGEQRVVWTLGATETWDEADQLAVKYHDTAAVDKAWDELTAYWEEKVGGFQADFPDAPTRAMVNAWSPYGTFVTFFRDRDISTDITGISYGIRFRDSFQNCMSIGHLAPEIATPRMELLLAHQRADGSAPNSFTYDQTAQPDDGHRPRCDNAVWPPMAVYAYLSETGDMAFLDKPVPYLDGGEGPVYEHLMAGLHQLVRDSGDNGLPLLKGCDWDDHLSLFGEEGAESVMTAQNWCYAAGLMKEICLQQGQADDAAWIEQETANYAEALNRAAWDGQWYRQVLYRGNKVALGSSDRAENKIYVNTQSWAVISGTAPPDRATLCMDKVRELLNSDVGVRLLWPGYTGVPEPGDPLIGNAPGLGENGGVFLHANTWAIMAEAMLGRGDNAFEYYRQVSPGVLSEYVGQDLYLNEPYMFSSHIAADPDPRKGMANISWMTGTVNWMYIVATQHILGVRPTLAGLQVRPALPSAWPEVRVTRRYRGATYRIHMVNKGNGKVTGITVDGTPINGDVLPVLSAGQEADVQVDL